MVSPNHYLQVCTDIPDFAGYAAAVSPSQLLTNCGAPNDGISSVSRGLTVGFWDLDARCIVLMELRPRFPPPTIH